MKQYNIKNRVRPVKTKGLAHLIAATGYSAQGFMWALREAAFRQELVLLPVLLVLHLLFDAGLGVCMIAVILWFLLLAVEALNTAIECIVDHLSPDWDEFAKQAKDLGSFAVFCLLSANVLWCSHTFLVYLNLGWN